MRALGAWFRCRLRLRLGTALIMSLAIRPRLSQQYLGLLSLLLHLLWNLLLELLHTVLLRVPLGREALLFEAKAWGVIYGLNYM